MAESQRQRILDALARGDGQMMSAFNRGHTAEIMYGKQADEIEGLIAFENKTFSKRIAADIEATAALLRGMHGDHTRRSAMVEAAGIVRKAGRALPTKAAR